MSITRKITRQTEETLEIAKCPVCLKGEVDVWDCGYSAFNPGTAECTNPKCKKRWKLGYVDDLWGAGVAWNNLAKRIAKRLDAFRYLEISSNGLRNRDMAIDEGYPPEKVPANRSDVQNLLSDIRDWIIGAEETSGKK